MSELLLRTALWLTGLSAVSFFLIRVIIGVSKRGSILGYRNDGKFSLQTYRYWKLFSVLCVLLVLAMSAILMILGAWTIRLLR